mmetsp:Transcript_20541/g.41104  ORF Transcript_20541/g.41104 Transcript_20541/m.41104 type:complete len:198 (-) Transcript_20541:39-632(-)
MSSDSSSSSSDGPVQLPSLGNLSLKTVAPALQVKTQSEPDYLDFDVKGRGMWEKTVASAGWGYLGGTVTGALYGLRTGAASSPNTRFKVRMNSLLNHTGRYGSRFGNAVGCVALVYSLIEGSLDKADADTYFPEALQTPALNPALAALLGGSLYKSSAGPRVAALAGTIGLGAVGVTYAVSNVVPGAKFGSTSFMFF